MFSPVSQISNPSSPFFSLSPPFISSFIPFLNLRKYGKTILLQLNLGLSMDSISLLLSIISLLSPVATSIVYFSISFFSFSLNSNSLTSLPSDVFNGLSSLSSLSISSRFLLFRFTLFHPSFFWLFLTTIFLPFPLPSSLVSLPSLSSVLFPFHCHPLFFHPFHILSQ